MAKCPDCDTEYPDDVEVCAKDGAPLGGTDRELPAGERVGEYDIESKLGEGGFGSVYRAVHPLIGKAAAIKVLGHRFSADREMVSRFIAEARAVNRIKHKNIIDIFSFGKLPDGRHYYVMELLDGVTLDQHMSKHGRVSVEEAIPILLGVARALDAAHAAGIVHRDLKPENIFLAHDEDGYSAKLLDFGIAKLFGDPTRQHQTRTGVPMGTPQYMSPEQCRGHNVDHRTDVYSFGVLVYRMLTGVLPFSADSAMDVMMLHVSGELPLASGRLPALGTAVDAALAHMLAKEPDKRPASVGAALEELAAAAREAGHDVSVPQARSLPPRGRDEALASAPTLPFLATPVAIMDSSSGDTLARATTASVGSTAAARSTGKRRALLAGLAAAAAVALVALLLSRPADSGRATAPSAPPASTPVTTQSAPAVAPALPSVQVASEVELVVESDPEKVEVFVGEKKLGVAPGPFKLPKSSEKVTLVLKASGYASRELEITPLADRVVSVRLDKGPRTGKPPPAGKKPEVEF